MARGWESKSVETQIEAAQSGPRIYDAGRTTEQNNRLRERQSLLLSRTRVMNDINAATHPRHRAMLQAALDHLDQKLTELG